MLLSCQNISKAFLEHKVLQNVSFHIEDYEKDEYVPCNSENILEILNFITEGHDVYYDFDFIRLEKFALNKLEV